MSITEGGQRPSSGANFSSLFSLLKKEKKAEGEAAAPAPPAKDGEAAASSEAAPVIPPVETSAPLEAEPAEAAAAESKDVPAATNGESKKDKAEKRKSSLPFLGKKEKVVSSDEEGEKPKSPSPFSKIRATIKVRFPVDLHGFRMCC